MSPNYKYASKELALFGELGTYIGIKVYQRARIQDCFIDSERSLIQQSFHHWFYTYMYMYM